MEDMKKSHMQGILRVGQEYFIRMQKPKISRRGRGVKSRAITDKVQGKRILCTAKDMKRVLLNTVKMIPAIRLSLCMESDILE
ncbi:TPA: hypothetical protein HA265_01235 [Candidatus Woesearchaeota archaeon]|nr:hypothetical protein [Candidatus Woesearchaeota archaeon]